MHRQPGLRMPAWNTLLALGDTLAVRAGWTGQDRTVSWLLSPRPSAVPSARRLTAVRLAAWNLHEQACTAALLAGELVADTLRHATDSIRLTLHLEDGLLRCEVEDTGPEPVAARPNPLPGRLACCSGVAGNVAWFELSIPEH
ncbi:ATP-binding protein [Nonomuraea sp. M3C6]|uniref:ATP-binding protein n=1 Tax=Nonomuraea marmarensis TaxID=3351344 RepID=A0ABW7AJ55_9ACTN